MKAQCPTRCGREVGNSHVLCDTCWATVPRDMQKAVEVAPLLIKRARGPMRVHAALRHQRLARERAVQYVVDRRNEEKVA